MRFCLECHKVITLKFPNYELAILLGFQAFSQQSIMLKGIFNTRAFIWFRFSSAQRNYTNYLSDHVVKIIQSKPNTFAACEAKMKIVMDETLRLKIDQNQLNRIESKQQQIKSKMNMIFRVYSLPEVLDKYKNELSDMVMGQKIKNQSDLDRICTILTKNIKIDKNYQIKDIDDMKKQAHHERQQFDRFIDQLKHTKQDISIPEISKQLRDKFITIQSKVIYQKLKQVQEFKKGLPKQNQSGEKQKQKANKQFWDKLQNIKPRLLSEQCNDAQTYKKHQQITKGRLRFRFPPQPNGYLHIGHIKSIRINFETAKRTGGICYLRYDDTNPQAQSHEYIENILKNVRWLGYEPDHITYASDYFQNMLQYAIQLIKSGHAYVCDSSQIDMERQRKDKVANKYRDRPIEQSLSMFPNLQYGQTLRLKLDPESKNPTLRDPVIYRIKQHPHPRTGNKYRIYPIYDFAHCICDSIEHIDYSLCSLEFQVRRELYYRILDLLKLYKPIVWEYSRLNVEGSVISKRKIKALIDSHAIGSWSDPRLLTIGGLLNRGYTPSMLISFIDKVNASRAGNQNVIQYSLLEREMRKQLFKISEKSMMVLNPQLIILENMKQQEVAEIKIEVYTDPCRKQKRTLKITKRLYIQKDEEILKKGRIIVLKYLGPFQVMGHEDSYIKMRKLDKQLKQLKQEKQQYKVIHWVSEQDSAIFPVTLFDKLLSSQSKVNQTSKTIHNNSMIPIDVIACKQDTQKYWQMQRLGYFKFDGEGNFIRCTTLQ